MLFLFIYAVLLQVELRDPFILYFQECKIEERNKWGPRFDEILERYLDNDSAVFCFLPLDYFKINSLYLWLLEVNNAQVCREIELLIDSNLSF